jgi:hypothetical protein
MLHDIGAPRPGLFCRGALPRMIQYYLTGNSYFLSFLATEDDSIAGSGEKFEPIITNPYLSIINLLFNEINQLFLEFLLEIEIFIENRLDMSLKFFILTGYFQISTGYLITKPRFSPDIAPSLQVCRLFVTF